MRSPSRMLAAVFVAACAWLCSPATAAPADAAPLAYAPCTGNNDFACAHLTVPLDPSGATPGTVTLALRRHRATVGEAHSAIIALAGGPGQPALPLSELFSEVLGSVAATRDLIVFDQRGIGESHPLSCHALERPDLYHSTGALVEACAAQIGPTRSFYATADTVADIEAIREAGGYEKLVVYGTSYGTKVAEEYAQQYPSHVEALVLDSVVPPNGPDPLDRATFEAIPRVLRQACSKHACAHVTANPAADLARVLRRIDRAPLRGRVIDGHGRAHSVPVLSGALFGMLLAGDFTQMLRAEFVTDVSAAAKGDPAALARLEDELGGGGEAEAEDFDTPLYFATTCEDQDAPWNRTSSPRARLSQAGAFARSLPASAFAPFDAAQALDFGGIEVCAHWPYSAAAQPSDQLPFPNVPTLILSGADDLRTPTANASEVAALIPDAQLLVVPYTGHSVLTDEPTACGHDALHALFAGHPVKACRATRTPPGLLPPPLPPRRVSLVAPAGGNRGLPGRTVHAVALTLDDLGRALVFKLESAISAATDLGALDVRVGGLRAGWARLANGKITLHGYSYVPGMTVSGTLQSASGELRVAGATAADGTLRVGAHTLTGTLGGIGVHLLQSPSATAAIVGDDAHASSEPASERAARRARARDLARLLGGGAS